MSLGKRFALADAAKKAAEIAEKLMPHCQVFPDDLSSGFASTDIFNSGFASTNPGTRETRRAAIAVAGSIRRGAAWVSDIDLVVIPKWDSKDALFGMSEELGKTDFCAAVRGELWDITAEGQKLIRGKSYIATSHSIGVDIFIASPESWATLLLIKTGSAMHNIWMCSRAIQCGGKLHADGSGLELAGQYDPVRQRNLNNKIVRPQSEEEIFKLLGLPYAEPRMRECVNTKPVWMPASLAAQGLQVQTLIPGAQKPSDREAPMNGGDVEDAAVGER